MKISVIIPTFNEERYIDDCIKSIVESDFDFEGTGSEIIIADGMSNDGTREKLEKYSESYKFIKIIDNVRQSQVFGLNLALDIVSGDIVFRLDAHSEYPGNYFSGIIDYYNENDASNVGGCWNTLPGDDSKTAHSIADSMSHPFGVGPSIYRIKKSGNPLSVDTVPFGCWKRENLDIIGKYDEEFIRYEDYDHNYRIRKTGKKIILLPWIKIKYYARDNWSKTAAMFFQYGYWKNIFFKKHKEIGTYRQFIPMFFVLSLIFSLMVSFVFPSFFYFFALIIFLYLIPLLIFSLSVAKNNRKYGVLLFFYNIISFPVIHFSYGAGMIAGIINVFILKRKPGTFVKKVTR